MHQTDYDVLIIGGGPAGIFAARELSAANLRVGLIDKGSGLSSRGCPRKQSAGDRCIGCNPCHLLCGWGGAGAFSDGKLTLSGDIGGKLAQYIGREQLNELISYVDDVYMQMGAPEKTYGAEPSVVKDMQRLAAAADLSLVPSQVRHLGTERCTRILGNLYDSIASKADVITGITAQEIITDNDQIIGVSVGNGRKITAEYVIVAPGREGSDWFLQQVRRLKISMQNNPVDVGIRVELPAVVLEPLTDVFYEAKLVYSSPTFDDLVRTFCVCPYGEVVIENNHGVQTVNGHSYADRKTDLTNFALLVSKTFTEPFKEPLKYGRYIAALANMLGGGVIVQRLGDLLAGRRSSKRRIERGMTRPTLSAATPGDLSLVLPHRHLTSLLEMLKAMDRICPGVCSRHTLLYGVEVKFYSARPELSHQLELPVRNLFAAGDGAGVTRGLIQASASGVHVARSILNRLHAES